MLEIINRLRKFNKERNWGQSHSPKNLVMALMVEVAELTEHFQWMTQKESQKVPKDLIQDEIADILIYSLILADKFNVNPKKAIINKIMKNSKRYPVSKSKGNSKKYDKF